MNVYEPDFDKNDLKAADLAQQAGAAKLAALLQRVTAIQPLEGKDVTDFYLAGGDLGAWIAFNLARLGL